MKMDGRTVAQRKSYSSRGVRRRLESLLCLYHRKGRILPLGTNGLQTSKGTVLKISEVTLFDYGLVKE